MRQAGDGNRVALLWNLEQACDAISDRLGRFGLGLFLRTTKSLKETQAAIEEERPGIVFAGLWGASDQPLELLDWLSTIPAPPPVVIIASGMDIPLYLEAMRRGAFDCMGVPLREHELDRIVLRALGEHPAQVLATGGS